MFTSAVVVICMTGITVGLTVIALRHTLVFIVGLLFAIVGMMI